MFRSLGVLILVAFFVARAPADAQNLLTNAGFESLSPSMNLTSGAQILNGWRFFSVNGASFTASATNETHEGNIAVRLTRSNTAGDAGWDRDDPALRVPVIGGRAYLVTLWAKAVGSASMIVTLAPYNSSGQWLGVQANQTFTLNSNYQRFGFTYSTPANTASLNLAIRVNGTGTIIIDDCLLADTTPKITYPVDEVVDRLKPTFGFTGLAHTAYQVNVLSGSTVVWDSGTMSSSGYSANCSATLQPSSAYQVKVRLNTTYGWGGYCDPVSFTTPAGPVVYFTYPVEADRIAGPDALLSWQVESPGGPTNQSLVIDGQPPVTVPNANRTYQLSGLAEGVHSAVLTVTTAEGTARVSSRFYVYNIPATGGTLYYYDCSYALNYGQMTNLAYDIPLAVFALQGIVNRTGPRLFVRMNSYDDRWFNILRAPGGWLAGKTIVTLPTGFNNIDTLFNTFRSDYNGAVVWDPLVYATSNVATTVAGADTLIPIRYDTSSSSVYRSLVMTSPNLPVMINLRNRFTGTGTIWGTTIPSTGSKKCDAYIWARTKYIETAGKSDPSLLLYAIDGYWSVGANMGALSNYLPIRDYVVRNKGFAFDLSVWDDETPIDDPNQTMGLDLNTMRSILAAASARAPGMIEMIGFCPFPMKYSNVPGAGGVLHGDVACEWEKIKWATYYNAYVDADALAFGSDMENASLYCQFPFPERLVQNRRLSRTDVRKLGYLDKQGAVSQLNYLNLYIGDYDSSSWLTRVGSDNWLDAGRGSVPMSWAFNPNLIKRAAPIYEYYNRTRTANDFFIAGDSGAGYVNPSRLIGSRLSGLPPAQDIWIAHNLNYFRKTNVKMTGFLLNGDGGSIEPNVESMYSAFSSEGVFQRDYADHMAGTMPSLFQISDIDSFADPSVSIDEIQPAGRRWAVQFLNYRSVIRTPTWIKTVYDGVAARDATIPWAFLDSATYAALAGCYLGKPPDCRATYTFDTIPATVDSGSFIPIVIGVRNDGWTTWTRTGSNRVSLVLKWMQGTQVLRSETILLPQEVPGGGSITLDVTTLTPSEAGSYTVRYELARGSVAFSALGDYAWEKAVTVIAANRFSPVTNFLAVPSDLQISLYWTNPTDPNFAGVTIRCKTTGYPTSQTDGTLVYNGAGSNCVHIGLANGTIYYYSAFAYNNVAGYSDAVPASARPQIFPEWLIETFDGYNVGGLGLQGPWLTVDGATSSGQAQTTVAYGGSGKAVLIDTVAGGAFVGNFVGVTDKTTGRCYVSFDVLMDLEGVVGAEGARVSIVGSDSTVEIAKVLIQKSRLLVEYGNGANTILTAAALNQTWYNIKFDLNIDAKTMDLWLDGVYKGTNYPWKPGPTRLSGIVMSSDRNFDLSRQKVYIDNVRLEPKPPNVAIVRDDGVWSPSLSKLHFSFDPIVGSSGYQYCVGTTTTGTQIRGWTSIGTATDFTATGMSLTENSNYYIGVACLNQFGGAGDRKNNNGIRVAPGLAGIAAAKGLPNSPTVYSLRSKVVSAVFPGFFYAQEPNGFQGLKIISTTTVAPGAEVDAAGFMAGAGAERYLDCTGNGVITTTPGPGVPSPLGMANQALGGGPLNQHTPGVMGGVGVNNIGFLVRTFGRFTYIDAQTFTVDDGSGIDLKCVVPASVTIDPDWSFVQVTGISSCETVGSELHRLLRVARQEDIDVVKL